MDLPSILIGIFIGVAVIAVLFILLKNKLFAPSTDNAELIEKKLNELFPSVLKVFVGIITE